MKDLPLQQWNQEQDIKTERIWVTKYKQEILGKTLQFRSYVLVRTYI